MIYLNEDHINQIGIDWNQTIQVIDSAVKCLDQNDYVQPIKPYLRFRDLKNRIIAMPAFLGGQFEIAGIKWIASFPENIKKGLPRAHSVVILNNADTGVPECIINTPLLSVVRTVSVSGLIVRYFTELRSNTKIKVGICGMGPIGKYHAKMLFSLLGDRISEINVFDIKGVDSLFFDDPILKKMNVVESWQDAYLDADIFITCTVSGSPYINEMPKSGSLHLNVSLRDYHPEMVRFFKGSIIVDNWDEICRENTDIQIMNVKMGLHQQDTKSIQDVVFGNALQNLDPGLPIFFNPMGMAIFDLAVGWHFCRLVRESETFLGARI